MKKDNGTITTLCEFEREKLNQRLRIQWSLWGGFPRLNCRIWFIDQRTGELRPTRAGFTVLPEELPQLEAAVKKATLT